MNDRPVVLIYQHFFPDFTAGGPVTSLGNLGLILKSSSDVCVITSNRIFSTGEPMRDVVPDQWSTWNGIPVWYASDRASVRSVIGKLPSTAVLYLNGVFLIDYFLVPLRIAARRRMQVVIAPRGMLQQGALRSGSLKKKFFLRMLTSVWLSGRERWHATDEEEKRDVEKWVARKAGVSIIPNVPRPPLATTRPLPKKAGQLNLIYYSLISRKKNLLFLIELLRSPELASVTLDIAGPVKDSEYWQECLKHIESLPDPSRVKYVGEQDPARSAELLTGYHFFALPTLGENYGHAIVEALGSSRPVIISKHTPWKDVQARGAGFALELDADHWRRTLVEALGWDQSTFDRSMSAALNYFADKIDMEQLGQQYRELFQQAGA